MNAASLSIPRTTAEALDPAWLTSALAPVTHGARVVSAVIVQEIRTVAAKIRIKVTFEDHSIPDASYCLKGVLDAEDGAETIGSTMVREADFYAKIAPKLSNRLPGFVNAIVDRDAPMAILILDDLIAQGGRFCGALEPFGVDDAAASLEQFARLHVGGAEFADLPWLRPWMLDIAEKGSVQPPLLQKMMDGPRGDPLPARTKNAVTLVEAVKNLARWSLLGPQTMIHSDAHAGNLFITSEGPGLIDWQNYQHGNWAVDVAYHIAAVLPVDVAEREERRLLDHYLDAVRRFGGVAPDAESAWASYRTSPVWGYYLWSITRFVEVPIIEEFVKRLGSSVTRHDSFKLLGV